MRVVALISIMISVAGLGCTFAVPLEGKACDPPDHECEPGFVCFEGTCFAEDEVPDPPDAGEPPPPPPEDAGPPPPPEDAGPPDAGPPPPDAGPVGPAPPVGLAVQAAGPYALLLTWADGPDDEDALILERAIGNGAFSTRVRLPAARVDFRDVEIEGGVRYRYRILAEAAGVVGAPSDEVEITVGSSRASDGLLALYTFRNTADATVFDRSAVAPPMDLTINDLAQVSQVDGELTFTGDTVRSVAADSSKLFNARDTDAFTVEMWITPELAAQGGPARIVTYSVDGSTRNWTLGQSNDQLRVRLRSLFSGDNEEDAFPLVFADATLVHIIVTFDSGLLRVFKDGAELTPLGTPAIRGSLENWQNNRVFGLGNEIFEGRQWKGGMNLVAVYDRALNAGEALQHFLVGVPAAEGDGDAIADDDDNCAALDNPDQANADGDDTGDACDDDDDNDGVLDGDDNCPLAANADQANADGDAFGDVCDPCVDTDDNDIDGDNLCAAVDNCPFDNNPSQADLDDDGVGDACDDDRDGDQLSNGIDRCPDTAGTNDDGDLDGFGDDCDLCAATFSNSNFDSDDDGVGDACDTCPHIDDDQTDGDGDGVGDACDPRPGEADTILFFDGFNGDALELGWSALDGVWRVEGGAARQIAPTGSSVFDFALLRRDDFSFNDVLVETSVSFDEPLLFDETAGVAFRLNATDGWAGSLGRLSGVSILELRDFETYVSEGLVPEATPLPGISRRVFGGAFGDFAFAGIDQQLPIGSLAAGRPSGNIGLFVEQTPASFDYVIVYGIDAAPGVSSGDDVGNLFVPGTVNFPTAAPVVLDFEKTADRDCMTFNLAAQTGLIAEITGGPAPCNALRATAISIYDLGVTDVFGPVVGDGNRSGDECSLALASLAAGDYVVCGATASGPLAGTELSLSERPIDSGGDSCADAPALPAAGSVLGVLGGVDDVDANGCGADDDGLDRMWSVTLNPGQTLNATLEMASGDEVLHVIDGCVEPITCIQAGDASGDGAESVSVTNTGAQPTTFFLVADEFNDVTNDAFLLDWSITP